MRRDTCTPPGACAELSDSGTVGARGGMAGVSLGAGSSLLTGTMCAAAFLHGKWADNSSGFLGGTWENGPAHVQPPVEFVLVPVKRDDPDKP